MSEEEINNDGVSVHTGFPNPALDRRGQQGLTLSLDQHLIRRPSSTYIFQISGHSSARNGIYDGDIAIVDRALSPKPNDLVICWQQSGFLICQFRLLPEDCEAWGVVTTAIHQFERH
jgi:DNA polymerase V